MSGSVKETAHQHSFAAKVQGCYSCGVCTGGCPVSVFHPEYNPRKILLSWTGGDREEVLFDPQIWYCCYCHACLEHCPQGLAVSEILTEFRQLAALQGAAPASELAKLEPLARTGFLVAGGKAIEQRREKLGLPGRRSGAPPPEVLQFVATIMQRTRREQTSE